MLRVSSLNLFSIAHVEAWFHSLVARDQYLTLHPNETLLYDWSIFHACTKTFLPALSPLPPTGQKSNGSPLTVSVLARISKIILSLKEIYKTKFRVDFQATFCTLLPLLVSQYFFFVTKPIFWNCIFPWHKLFGTSVVSRKPIAPITSMKCRFVARYSYLQVKQIDVGKVVHATLNFAR